MAGSLIPAPLNAANYQTQLSPGTYSALFQDTVGAAGDDGDPIDLQLGDLTAQISDWLADFPNLDADVAALQLATTGIDSSGADGIVAALPNADSAVQSAKLAYLTNTQQTVGPSPQPGGAPAPLKRGDTDPDTYGPFTGLLPGATAIIGEVKLRVMVLGDPPQTWVVNVGPPVYGTSGRIANSEYLVQGDPAVISVAAQIIGDQYQAQLEAVIYASATKVGRFPFAIQYNLPRQEQVYYVVGGVTIIDK